MLTSVRPSPLRFCWISTRSRLAGRPGEWMVAEGLWLSRKQRRSFHQPRLRRESYGELIQIDGSEHRWFEQRGEPCTLLVFIDDATSQLMQLRFVPSESTTSYFEALRGYLDAHGCPVAFYSDKHSVFRVNRSEAKGGSGMTQFGRALAELNIEIICANSSQAKGRVERANRTLQDRLVKELRIENVSSIEAGNVFLPGFISRFNGRFAVRPAKIEDLHRTLRVTAGIGLTIYSAIANSVTLANNSLLPMIASRSSSNEAHQRRDRRASTLSSTTSRIGRLEVRSKGHVLPYRVFSKDQRVNHAAIVENKRLGHALYNHQGPAGYRALAHCDDQQQQKRL